MSLRHAAVFFIGLTALTCARPAAAPTAAHPPAPSGATGPTRAGAAHTTPTAAPQADAAHTKHGAHHGAEHQRRDHSTAEEHEDTRPTATHRFEDAERWSRVFDDPQRDAWQKPRELIAHLALQADAVVADLGTGTGYFVESLSRAVPRGRVLAVDLEPNLLAWVEKRARRAGLKNVKTVLAGPDDPKLPEPVDLVLVVDTYHHIGERIAYFARLKPRLLPKGRITIVDFRMGKLPFGPPDSHKLPPNKVEREMKLAGYALCESWDGLPHQYALTFAVDCP